MNRALGLEARTVIGTAGAGNTSYSHAWSEVKVGNRWFSLDAVWKCFDPSAGEFGQTHRKTREVY